MHQPVRDRHPCRRDGWPIRSHLLTFAAREGLIVQIPQNPASIPLNRALVANPLRLNIAMKHYWRGVNNGRLPGAIC
jgi:hypothetical protein